MSTESDDRLVEFLSGLCSDERGWRHKFEQKQLGDEPATCSDHLARLVGVYSCMLDQLADAIGRHRALALAQLHADARRREAELRAAASVEAETIAIAEERLQMHRATAAASTDFDFAKMIATERARECEEIISAAKARGGQ